MGDYLSTGPNFPLVISQAPGGDLQDPRREQSDFLGIVDEDAIGAVFLLDKCRQRIQVGAFCCHPKFYFDRNSNARGVCENEVHFRPASCAIVGGFPRNAFRGREAEQDFFDDMAFKSRPHARPCEELLQVSHAFQMAK